MPNLPNCLLSWYLVFKYTVAGDLYFTSGQMNEFTGLMASIFIVKPLRLLSCAVSRTILIGQPFLGHDDVSWLIHVIGWYYFIIPTMHSYWL